MQAHNIALLRLSDADLILADETQDIRNRTVIDVDGTKIGHIQDLFIDKDEKKVRMLEIRAGGFLGIGDRHFLLPIDAVTSVAANDVHVNETLGRIVGSPVYDPKLVTSSIVDSWTPYYGYYGLAPFWGLDYVYPTVLMERDGDARPSDSRHDRFVR